MDNEIKIEQTIFNNYDTIIFDLDGVIWQCFSSSGSSIGAYATEAPYILENAYFIKDVNGGIIKLEKGVREVIKFLSENDRNLGIMSAGEKDETPFEAQPSIMLLKKFDLIKYFNYDIILKRLDNREETKKDYVKPLGKTLFIDDDITNLQNVNSSGKVDVLPRHSFTSWLQLLQPIKNDLHFGSQKLAYFFGDDEDNDDSYFWNSEVMKGRLKKWKEEREKYEKERMIYEEKRLKIVEKELPAILNNITYQELPILIRNYVENYFKDAFEEYPDAKLFLQSVKIDILPHRGNYGGVAEYFKDENRIEFYYKWSFDKVIRNIIEGKESLSNKEKLREYFIDKYFNKYIIHELVHAIQNFFTSNNFIHKDVAKYPNEEHPEYRQFGEMYLNDEGEKQAHDIANKFKFPKSEEKKRGEKYGEHDVYTSLKFSWQLPKNLKQVAETLALPEDWIAKYIKNKYSEKIIIYHTGEISLNEEDEDFFVQPYRTRVRNKIGEEVFTEVARTVDEQLKALGYSDYIINTQRAAGASIEFSWPRERMVIKKPREVLQDLIRWGIPEDKIYKVRGSTNFIKIFLEYLPNSNSGKRLAKEIISLIQTNYNVNAYISTSSIHGGETRFYLMILIPNKIVESSLKFSWQFNDYSELKKVLDEEGYSYKDLGNELIINHRGDINLPSLTFLPDNIQFNNKGYVSFYSLTSLPENIQFNNKGYVDLPSLTSLPDNIQFNNGENVHLDSLTSLPENIQFNNEGDVFLYSLQFLPENKYEIFHNEGIVYYDWDGDKYTKFNPYERNASLKFSWKIPKEEINVGDKVKVTNDSELLSKISLGQFFYSENRTKKVENEEGVVIRIDPVYSWRKEDYREKYIGIVKVSFSKLFAGWSFPYSHWQDFLEVIEVKESNLKLGELNETDKSKENSAESLSEGKKTDTEVFNQETSPNNEETELTIYYPDVEDLIEMHSEVINDYGGKEGLFEGGRGKLEAAIGRMMSGFGEEEFYPSVIEKAAVLVHSIVTTHPFIDGNKRTGFIAALEFLHFNGFVMGESEELADIIIKVASDEARYEHLLEWIKMNSHQIQDKHRLTIRKLTYELSDEELNNQLNALQEFKDELSKNTLKDIAYWERYVRTYIEGYLKNLNLRTIYFNDETVIIKLALDYLSEEIPEEVKEDHEFQKFIEKLRGELKSKYHEDVLEKSDLVRKSEVNEELRRELMERYRKENEK